MGKIAIELNVPDEILKTLDINRLKRIIEREIVIEHSVKNFTGSSREWISKDSWKRSRRNGQSSSFCGYQRNN